MPTAGADGLLATEDSEQSNSIPMRSCLLHQEHALSQESTWMKRIWSLR